MKNVLPLVKTIVSIETVSESDYGNEMQIHCSDGTILRIQSEPGPEFGTSNLIFEIEEKAKVGFLIKE